MQRHEGDPGEEGTDVRFLEALGDDVQRARLTNADAALPQWTGLRSGQHPRRRPRWVIALVVDDRRQPLPIVQQGSVRLRIRLRKPG